MSNLVPFEQMQGMANAISSSGLFGITRPEQALALMVVAQAEGRHPGIVARDYHIIQGKPSLKADAMLARFQEAGGTIKWHEMADVKADATFSHPQGGELRMSWCWADAVKAGLATKDIWKKYPRAMLRSRLISEGIRSVYPAVLCGVYTEEEVQSFTPIPEKDITPIPVVNHLINEDTIKKLKDLCFKITEIGIVDKGLLEWINSNQDNLGALTQEYADRIILAMNAKITEFYAKHQGFSNENEKTSA